MALKPTETIETVQVEVETEIETEVKPETPATDLGIHIKSADGTILAAGFTSTEAAQAHIDGHLTADCTVETA